MEVGKNQRLREFVNYQIRERKIKNDTDFAKKMGSPRSVVSDFLCAKRRITDKTILKIKWAFPELNEKWLDTGDGQMLVEPDSGEPQAPADGKKIYKSADLLAGVGGGGLLEDSKLGRRLEMDKNLGQALVSVDEFLDKCRENVELQKDKASLQEENLNLRRRIFAMMERMAKEGLPCNDEIC